jgi:hypothetical protein
MLPHVGGAGTEGVRGFGLVDDLVPAPDEGGNHHPRIKEKTGYDLKKPN